MRATDFCDAAIALEGVKWRHQGRNPEIALDCIGLLVAAARACGVDLEPERPRYGINPKPEVLLLAVETVARRVYNGKQPGDVLLIEFTPRMPQHLAIVLPDNRAAHCSMHTRRVTIEPMDDGWVQRTHSIWRLRQLEQHA